jgi:sugar lactone lactonase YvrE
MSAPSSDLKNSPVWTTVSTVPDMLGESPFWHPTEKMLYWIDIPGKKIHRSSLDGMVTDGWDMTQEPGCIAPAKRGGLIIALRDGIYRAAHWQADLVKIASVTYDTATQRFNDGKCDTAGRFWAGSMFEPRTERLAALYRLDSRDTVDHKKSPKFDMVQKDAILANGLGWSPDNKTIYWADTVDQIIHAWDWDAVTGSMSNKRVFQKFDAKPAGRTLENSQGVNYQGRPDGCAIDTQGNYYIAMYDGQCILKFAPSGKLLETIPTPTRCTTMPCFGGEDMKTLFITTSSFMRSAEELKAQPLAGHVFSMQVDIPGLPVNFYQD